MTKEVSNALSKAKYTKLASHLRELAADAIPAIDEMAMRLGAKAIRVCLKSECGDCHTNMLDCKCKIN